MLEEVQYRLRGLARFVVAALQASRRVAESAFETARVLEARGREGYRRAPRDRF